MILRLPEPDAGMSRDELAAAVLAVLNNSKESGSDVQSVLNNNISVNAKAENTVSHSGTLLKGITRIKKVSARAGRLLPAFPEENRAVFIRKADR